MAVFLTFLTDKIYCGLDLKMFKMLHMHKNNLQAMFVYVEYKDQTYLSIAVRVYLAVRVAAVAGISTPGPWSADLS